MECLLTLSEVAEQPTTSSSTITDDKPPTTDVAVIDEPPDHEISDEAVSKMTPGNLNCGHIYIFKKGFSDINFRMMVIQMALVVFKVGQQ